MTLTDYKEAVIVDNEFVRFVYPEDKLKSAMKELKEMSKFYIAATYRAKVSNYDKFCKRLDKIFGAELNGQI